MRRCSLLTVFCFLACSIQLAGAYPLHNYNSIEERTIKIPAEVTYALQKSKAFAKDLWTETVTGKSIDQHIDAVFFNVFTASPASLDITWKLAMDWHEGAIRAINMANKYFNKHLEEPGHLERAVAFAKAGARAGDEKAVAWLQALAPEYQADFEVPTFVKSLSQSAKKPVVVVPVPDTAASKAGGNVVGTIERPAGVASSPLRRDGASADRGS